MNLFRAGEFDVRFLGRIADLFLKPGPQNTAWEFAGKRDDPVDLYGAPVKGLAMRRYVKGEVQYRQATRDEWLYYIDNVAC